MFSAIFGNFLFSRVEEPTELSSKFSEASTQTSDNKSTSTQVNLDESKNNESLNDTATSQQDWVIVDDSEAATEGQSEKTSLDENLVEMNNIEPNPEPLKEEDALLGSFFEKNETCTDEERYKSFKRNLADEEEEPKPIEIDNQIKTVETQTVLPQPKKNETWLITPLPCLTSITESSQQRSMINNDPLENLLIEQPNRFMSTSEIKAPVNKRRAKKRQVAERKPQVAAESSEIPQSDDVCEINFLFTEAEIEPVTPIITKRTSEKRKEAEKSSSPVSPVMNESPKKVSRKSNKHLKKQQGSTQANKTLNKENMQVKTLLLSEYIKNPMDSQKCGNNRYGQMNRANKNAALFAMANNTRQRKFHNLQQPSFIAQAKAQF